MDSSESKPPASRSEVRILGILGVAILIAFLLALVPVFIKQNKAANRTKALGNVRQIGMSLFEFESEYGRFPDEGTADEVRKRTKTGLKLSGQYSNDYFRQLIAVGLKSELPFWCETALSPRKPDNNWNTSKALEAGEVGYSYIMKAPGRGSRVRMTTDERSLLLRPSFRVPNGASIGMLMKAGRLF